MIGRESGKAIAAITTGVGVVATVYAAFGTVAAWIALSIIGLGLSLYLSNESRHDLMALPNRTNGRRVAAWSRLFREGLRVTVHAAYLLAGLAAAGAIDARWLVIPALMWGNTVMVTNSLIDARTRYLLFASRDAEPPLPH